MLAKDKIALLKLARDSITTYFTDTKPSTDEARHLRDKRGVFVTLFEKKELRGCIGFPHPTHPLYVAIVEAARSAAFGDPRFPPLLESELSQIKIEISVLTEPALVKVDHAEEYLRKIQLGTDGLIIKGEAGTGLLLPQVAIEHGFTPSQFLNAAAQKAGLPFSAWKNLNNKIYTFQAEVFSEK